MGEERIILPPPPSRRRENAILEELQGALGLTLWQTVRHLHAWAESSREVRAVLFNRDGVARRRQLRLEASAQAPELSVALEALETVPTDALTVDRSTVSDACILVVDWALAHEFIQTAIEYAEVAAHIDSENPGLANRAGRITREAHDYARSEVWFNRGIGLARERDRRVELTRAHLGYGILLQDLGRVQRAMHHFNSGSRIARRAGLHWLAAEVQHDLMLLLTVRGQYAAAEKHAERALRWYGRRHERFPLFAADTALLMVLERNYALASRFAKGAFRHVSQPSARAVILALYARALAGGGFVDDLDRLRRRVLRITEEYHEREAVALWHLAAAERSAGRWEEADATAGRALELAVAHGDRETGRVTRRLLAAIRMRNPAPPPCPVRKNPAFLKFVASVTSRLSAWSPERRIRPAVRTGWAA